MIPQPFDLRAPDGRELAAHWFAAPQRRGVIVMNGATGFPQTFYFKLAQYAAERGYDVLLYDYRGMGFSASGSPRRGKSAHERLGPARHARGAGRRRGTRAGSARGDTRATASAASFSGCCAITRWHARHVQIATSVGYWRWEHAPFKYLAWWFWRVHGPLMLALKGYIPTGGGWAGLPLPRGVYEEWRRWCLRPDHFGPDLATYLADNYFADIRAPLLTVGFTDDPIATRRTVDELNKFFPNVARESRWYSPADAGSKRIGHEGFFASRHRDTLWRPVIDWIDAQTGRCRMIRPIQAGTPADHITPYDRLALDEATLISLLASGTPNEGLVEYFGAELHAELAKLARATTRKPARRARAAPPRLRAARHHGLAARLHPRRQTPNDILWLDPIDIAFGRLTELALNDASRVVRARRDELQLSQDHAVPAQGRLRRRAARLRLAARHRHARRNYSRTRIAADGRDDVALIGHSMGGLVARAALTHAAGKHVSQLIMLGTPNAGSLAAVQALRGTYSVVRKIAMLDLRHDAEYLARNVFASFPGLHELLPANNSVSDLDLFDAARMASRRARAPMPRCCARRPDSSSAWRPPTRASTW